MACKVLIMGLPGSGKTTLASALVRQLKRFDKTVVWYNADQVRKLFNDWDFSTEGRLRQARRMRDLAGEADSDFVIVDFVAPLAEMRDIFAADWTFWLNTIQQGRFEDTNRAFVPPSSVDVEITFQDAEAWAPELAKLLVDSV